LRLHAVACGDGLYPEFSSSSSVFRRVSP
jgi:hypothetical protein